MDGDLFKSVEESIKKNIADFRKEQDEKRKRESAEKAKCAEEYFFAMKVAKPAKVKNIFRLHPEQNLEEKLVDHFVGHPLANPCEFTTAMEGKPFVALVSMDNGLKYRAAMTRLMYIHWPKGTAQNMSPATMKLLLNQQGENPQRPTIYADKIEYALLLWPLHKEGRVDETDFIDVRWDTKDDIVTFQEKEGEDAGDGIHTKGAVRLGGTAVCLGSFMLLNNEWGIREKYPRHFHHLFGEVQQAYDRARGHQTLGKTIFTLFDPAKPARGVGWTIPILPSEKRIYFEIPEVKVVNPNQPFRLAHKKATLLPRRIQIDCPVRGSDSHD